MNLGILIALHEKKAHHKQHTVHFDHFLIRKNELDFFMASLTV